MDDLLLRLRPFLALSRSLTISLFLSTSTQQANLLASFFYSSISPSALSFSFSSSFSFLYLSVFSAMEGAS